MIAGLLALAAANAATVQGARALLGRLRMGDPALDAVLFMLLRLLLCSAAVLAAGLTSMLSPWPLGIAGLAALAVLSRVPGAHRAVPRLELSTVPFPLRVAIGVLALRFLAQTWFFSPADGDAVGYHLPKIAEWIRAGAFTRSMGSDTHVTFPAGFELMETWWSVFLRHDALIELAGVEFVALGSFAAWAIARRAGLSEGVAPWAGVLFAATPGILLQATACLNDAPASACVAAAFAFAAAGASWPLLALPVLLGIGIKGTVLYAMSGVLLLRLIDRRSAPATRGAVAAAVLALAVGAFWYLRNLAWFGNPVYPLTSAGLDFGEVKVQSGPRLESLALNLDRYFGLFLPDRDWVYATSLRQASGWGAAGFGFGLIALLLLLRSPGPWRGWTASFALSTATVFLLVSSDAWFGRFVLFTAALLAPALAALAARSRPLAGAVAVAAVLQFGLTLVPGNLGWPRAAALARQPVATRSMAAVYGVPELPDRVGLWNDERTIEYLLYRPDFSAAVVVLRLTDPERLPDEMRAAGVTAVLVHLRAGWVRFSLDRLVAAGNLKRLGENFYGLP